MFSSYEMTEWQAYEEAFGPVNGMWDRETLAQIHELLQTMAYIAGAQAEENPVPQPRTKDRPGSAFGFERDEFGLYSVPPPEAVEKRQDEERAEAGALGALDSYIAEDEKGV